VLDLRDILACKVGIGYQGAHNPILPCSLSRRLRQRFALPLRPCLMVLQHCAVASSLLQRPADPMRVFSRSCRLLSSFAQHTSPQCCFSAQEGQLLINGRVWKILLEKMVFGLMESHGWLGGLGAAGWYVQGCTIHVRPGTGPWTQSWPVQWSRRILSSWD